jgi:hypothetical protein
LSAIEAVAVGCAPEEVAVIEVDTAEVIEVDTTEVIEVDAVVAIVAGTVVEGGVLTAADTEVEGGVLTTADTEVEDDTQTSTTAGIMVGVTSIGAAVTGTIIAAIGMLIRGG